MPVQVCDKLFVFLFVFFGVCTLRQFDIPSFKYGGNAKQLFDQLIFMAS